MGNPKKELEKCVNLLLRYYQTPRNKVFWHPEDIQKRFPATFPMAMIIVKKEMEALNGKARSTPRK